MKNLCKKAILLSFSLAISSVCFGQKMMETSAASEYENKFLRAFDKKDFAVATESILKAKEFIDQASINEETKNNPKTQYYKAFIYLGLVNLTQATSKDELKIKEYQEIADVNLLLAYNNPNTKFKDKVQDYVNQKANSEFDNAILLSNSKQYESAMISFIQSSNTQKTIGVKMQVADENAEKCLIYSVRNYLAENKLEEANRIIQKFSSYYPKNRQALLFQFELQMKKTNVIEMEKVVDEYTKTYPTDTLNKILYFNLGTTILNSNEFEKAEKNYKKALSFDGMYIDAIYQLAVTNISWEKSLRKEASMISTKDPKYKILEEQTNKALSRAISSLSKYTAVVPTDKEALLTLSRAYGRTGDEVKAAEVKAKADAIK